MLTGESDKWYMDVLSAFVILQLHCVFKKKSIPYKLIPNASKSRRISWRFYVSLKFSCFDEHSVL